MAESGPDLGPRMRRLRAANIDVSTYILPPRKRPRPALGATFDRGL